MKLSAEADILGNLGEIAMPRWISQKARTYKHSKMSMRRATNSFNKSRSNSGKQQ